VYVLPPSQVYSSVLEKDRENVLCNSKGDTKHIQVSWWERLATAVVDAAAAALLPFSS
jgi:hypothetical protein